MKKVFTAARNRSWSGLSRPSSVPRDGTRPAKRSRQGDGNSGTVAVEENVSGSCSAVTMSSYRLTTLASNTSDQGRPSAALVIAKSTNRCCGSGKGQPPAAEGDGMGPPDRDDSDPAGAHTGGTREMSVCLPGAS